MIQKLLWKILGKKCLLGGAVEIYRKITGYKTQIVSVLLVVVYVAKILGYLPPDLAEQLIALLSGAGGITLAQKLKRWDEQYKLTQHTGELKAEAMKELAKDGVTTTAMHDGDNPQNAVRG